MLKNKRDDLKKEDIIRELDINNFDIIVKGYSKSIIKLYDICLDRLSKKKGISIQLSDLNGMLIDFRLFINNVIKNNKNLLSDDKFKDIILRTKSFIYELDKDYSNLKNSNNNLKKRIVNNNKDNKEEDKIVIINKNKIKSDPNVDEFILVDRYLKRLSKGKNVILQIYPNMDNFVDGTIKYLSNVVMNKDNMYKDDVRVILDNIKISLLEQFNYNIDDNTIKRMDTNIDSNKEDEYISLLSNIDDYIRNYEKNKELIINNLLALGNDEDRYNNYVYYKDMLYNISVELLNRSRSIDDISKDFDIIKKYIKNKLGYNYKINNNKRIRRR